MPSLKQTNLVVGSTCIIHVGQNNDPRGWWFGVVTEVTVHATYTVVLAHITGPFEMNGDTPVYGIERRHIASSYSVYEDTPDTRAILWKQRQEIRAIQQDLDTTAIRLDELRRVLRPVSK